LICIYTSEVSPRVSYTFRVFFEEILETDFVLTSNDNEYDEFLGPKFVYGLANINDSIHFGASGLLNENNIRDLAPEVVVYDGVNGLFSVNDGVLPFDPFSAAFYLLSRYEEYTYENLDVHGRFSAENSVAFKNDFLKKPVVNQYAELVKDIILEKYPDYLFKSKETVVVPTIDIDNAYAYSYKGLFFHLASLTKKLIGLKFKRFLEHLVTILNVKNDPYNSYQKQFDVHKSLGLKPVYFFLVGKKGKYDRNLSLKNEAFQKLIQTVAARGEVGVHPSYGSLSGYEEVKFEKNSLEKVLGKEVTSSRQHYLKMSFPKTYLTLEKVGVKNDYSMGYASQIGFRAGICTPYTFYFLDEERESNIKVHPFCVMDATIKYYLEIDPDEILNQIRPVFKNIKKVKGEITLLFHNESIGEKNDWKSWQGLYERVLKEALH